jgi:spermidine synthase
MEDYKVDVPEGEKGDWRITKYTVGEKDRIHQLSSMFNSGRYVPDGTYTRLIRNNKCIMSDTPDEVRDHHEIIHYAKGNVLIVGLGLGMVLNAIAKREDVTHVTIIEKSQDVIDLVSDHYLKKYLNKITIINADIFDWIPNKDCYYDFAWYDIWDDLCTDNLEEMKKIHRKLAKKTGWQGSWGREFLKRRKRQERRLYGY